MESAAELKIFPTDFDNRVLLKVNNYVVESTAELQIFPADSGNRVLLT